MMAERQTLGVPLPAPVAHCGPDLGWRRVLQVGASHGRGCAPIEHYETERQFGCARRTPAEGGTGSVGLPMDVRVVARKRGPSEDLTAETCIGTVATRSWPVHGRIPKSGAPAPRSTVPRSGCHARDSRVLRRASTVAFRKRGASQGGRGAPLGI